MTPKKTAVAFLAILMIAQVAIAQKAVVTVNQPGTYLVSVVNGQIVMEPVRTIVIGPVTPDPVVPVDPDLSPKAKEIAVAAGAAADPTTAGNLAEVMTMVKSQVDGGTLTNYKQIAAATMWLMDSIIGKQEAKWKPTKDVVSGHLAALAQEGARPEEYSGYFADAADGFEAAIPDSDILERERINIETLMKLFEFFIKYILPLIL